MKHVSEHWAALTKQNKQCYVKLAFEDKKRFEQELNDLRYSKIIGFNDITPCETRLTKPPEAKSLRYAMEQAADLDSKNKILKFTPNFGREQMKLFDNQTKI